jgi:carbamoyl-phosphate synthase large subunit
VKRVLITGTGGTGVGAGVLQCLQEPAVRSRWWPVAACAETFAWGLYAARERFLVPWAAEPGYFGRIAEIAGTVDAVIPGTEAETVLLAQRRDELPVPVIANSATLMPLMADKLKAAAMLTVLGLPSVPSYPWEQYPQACADFGFPLVVKPTLNTSGSRGVHLVTGIRQLDALDTFARPDTVVQPYLGDASSEYTVGVVSTPDAAVVGSIVIRRELRGVSLLAAQGDAAVSTGFSQGYIVDYPELAEFCEDLAKRLGSTGPLNLQVRVHHGEFYVFEIHPRFSFSCPIRASAGFNEPDMLLRAVLHGEDITCPAYVTGVAAIRAFQHVLVPVQEMLR